jgi:hypothetical protein
VATDFDRDDRLHGLLRDTLRSQPASGPCIDAATLAAWAEDALTPEETAATDAHLAACARCRDLAATLATMTDAEGAPASTVVQFAARPNGRWKVIVGAMGAIAASALIWVAVRDEAPMPDTTSAANRSAQSQDSGVGGNVAPPATAPAQRAESNALLPRADAAAEAERQLGQQGQRALNTPRPEAKLARESNARTAEPRQFNATPTPTPAPVEPPPARVAAPPPPAAMPPPPQPAAAAPPAIAGSARSSTVASLPPSETFFAMPIVAEFVVGADLQAPEGLASADRIRAGGAGRGGGGGGARGAGGGAAAGGVAQRPTDAVVSQPVRWRLRGSSTAAVERSIDGGTTWLPVPIPVTPLLAGGSAPANTVCWLAGRAGTVLLSTDGTTFRQVTKPADADLVSVRATDARSATVRTADGRTFTTTDGGLTWTSRSDSPSQ